MSKCQLVCVPSLYEGFPNVVMEAMALGVPVIAGDAPGSAELLKGEKFGDLVPRDNVSELANAIIRFAENPEVSLEKAAVAKQYVRSQHSIGAIVPTIERLMLRHLEV